MSWPLPRMQRSRHSPSFPASLSKQIGSAPFQTKLLSQISSWPAHASKFTRTEGRRTCRKAGEGRGSGSERKVGGDRQAERPHGSGSPARPERCLYTLGDGCFGKLIMSSPGGAVPGLRKETGVVTCGNQKSGFVRSEALGSGTTGSTSGKP